MRERRDRPQHRIERGARYPPYYYAAVGGVVKVAGASASVRAYRAVSALGCALLIAVALALIRRSRVRRLLPIVLASLPPMALFMLASVNPNAAEIAGFVLVWALLVRLSTDERPSERLALATSVMAGVLVMSRPVSAVWLAAVAAVVLIATERERRRLFLSRPFMIRLAVPLAVSAVATYAWLRWSSFEVSDSQVASSSLGSALQTSLEKMGEYYRQAVGVLGWLDTDLPVITYGGWTLALLAAAALAVVRAPTRLRVAFGVLVVAWMVAPLGINAFTAADAGLTYQGRYSLPILAGAAFVPMLDATRPVWSPRRVPVLPIVVAVLAVAEVAAFWQTIRRFLVGAEGKIWLTGEMPWRPGVPPMVLVAANALVMIAICAGAVVASTRPLED